VSQGQLDTSPEWVIFGWATGQRGSVRIAFIEGAEEPGPMRMQEAKAAVLQHYRQVYYGASRWDKEHKGEDDWPTPNVMTRNEAGLTRKTFSR
jgi:hypothetical protein